MCERLTDEELRKALCIWADVELDGKKAMVLPCGECQNCKTGRASMAHELLERREADKAVDGACRLAWKNGAPWPIP